MGWAGLSKMDNWNMAEMLYVCAKLLSCWPEKLMGRIRMSTCKWTCWPTREKHMMRVV